MSHFVVLVETEKYVDEENSQELSETLRNFYEGNDDVDEKYLAFEDETSYVEEKYEELSEEVKKEYKDVYDFADEYFGYRTIEKDGEKKIGWFYNSQAKWDWYDIGGRWDNLLKTKSGEFVNCCQIKDLDLSPDKEKYEQALRWWSLYVEKGLDNLTDSEKEEVGFVWYKPEYYKERYGTAEAYATKIASLSAYAILAKGEWLEPGQMGWFGISNASTEDEQNWDKNFLNIIKSLDPERYITVVDCHI